MPAREVSGVSGGITTIVLAAALAIGAVTAEPASAAGRQAQMQIRPTSGPAGTQIDVRAKGVPVAPCSRYLDFVDSGGAVTFLEALPNTQEFRTKATIPGNAAPGPGQVRIENLFEYPPRCIHPFPVLEASTSFTVTG